MNFLHLCQFAFNVVEKVAVIRVDTDKCESGNPAVFNIY